VEQLSWFSLAGHQVLTESLPPPQLDRGGKKYNERLMGQDKDKERSLIDYCRGQNSVDLGKLIYHQSNRGRIMRKKTKS